MKLPGYNNKARLITGDHNTGDIIELVLNQDGKFQNQTNKFTAKLKGLSLYDQCFYIWETLRNNVQYVADTPLNQELKSPARLFHDGVGDCKSFSLFEASCLRNLGIPYCYRFVSFRPTKTPTHVYIIAMPGTSQELIMDGVLPKFNYQKPYTSKYDIDMPLSMLTGVGDVFSDIKKAADKIAADLKHSAEVNAANAKKYKQDPKKLAADVNKTLVKIVDLSRKLEPAEGLIKGGILLIASTNLFNTAGKLHLGYLTPAEAQARHYDMNEFKKLQADLNRLVKTYTDMAGSASVLKDAIMTGSKKPAVLAEIWSEPRTNAEYIGLEPISATAAIAAAVPIVLVIIHQMTSDPKKLTANSANGYSEQQANAPSTINDQQLADLAAGAAQLAADTAGGADASVLQKDAADTAAQVERDATKPKPYIPQGGGVKPYPAKKKDNSMLIWGLAGAAGLYLYSKSKH